MAQRSEGTYVTCLVLGVGGGTYLQWHAMLCCVVLCCVFAGFRCGR
jgi:hypothetical protein